eukprot:9108564-Pyramimonas_sp.AAC.1
MAGAAGVSPADVSVTGIEAASVAVANRVLIAWRWPTGVSSFGASVGSRALLPYPLVSIPPRLLA